MLRNFLPSSIATDGLRPQYVFFISKGTHTEGGKGSDAEVLQELLHRYVAIARPEAIQPAFDALLGIVDQVLAIDRVVVEPPTDCPR